MTASAQRSAPPIRDLATDLLGAHVERGAQQRSDLGLGVVRLIAIVLGNAEVENLRGFMLVARHQEDVWGFEVAVHDTGCVSTRQGTGHLHHYAVGLRGSERLFPEQACAEILPLEQLHDDVLDAVPLPVIEHFHRVGAVDLGGRHGLSMKAYAHFLALRLVGLDELDGTATIERQILGQPDGAHAARAELFFETVAFAEVHRSGRHPRGGCVPSTYP